jgi:hypothetical protein
MRTFRVQAAVLAAAWHSLSCAAQGPAFESVTTLPKPARHPAGADIEPAPAWPSPERRATTSAGLVVLRTPLDPAAARSLVAAFFRAVIDESPRALSAVFTRDAVMQNGPRRESAVSLWAGRFGRFDYRSLAAESVYRAAELKLWQDEESLMARARVDVAWGSRPRMFGDELTFRLVPNGAGWLIAEVLEDFQTP